MNVRISPIRPGTMTVDVFRSGLKWTVTVSSSAVSAIASRSTGSLDAPPGAAGAPGPAPTPAPAPACASSPMCPMVSSASTRIHVRCSPCAPKRLVPSTWRWTSSRSIPSPVAAYRTASTSPVLSISSTSASVAAGSVPTIVSPSSAASMVPSCSVTAVAPGPNTFTSTRSTEKFAAYPNTISSINGTPTSSPSVLRSRVSSRNSFAIIAFTATPSIDFTVR